MAVTTPALGGTTLPQVAWNGYDETPGYRGADTIMASGAMVTDLISTSLKRSFELRWVGLSEAQVTTVLTAFATVDSGSASFTSPVGGSHTVTREVGQLAINVNWYTAAGTLRADVTMRLREV